MNVDATRDELAAAAAAAASSLTGLGWSGYREFPSELAMPAAVVLDPEELNYHDTYDTADTGTWYVRLIVPVAGDGTTVRPLDQLLAPEALPVALQDHDAGGVWARLSVIRKRPGPYITYLDTRRQPVGVSADLELRIEF